MPRQPAALPIGVEVHPSAPNKVRCIVCFRMDPHTAGKWMLQGSISKHLNSDVHKQHVRQHQEEEEENIHRHEVLMNTYSGASADTRINSFSIPEKTLHPSISQSTVGFSNADIDEIRDHFLEPLDIHDEEDERSKLEAEAYNIYMQAMEEELEEAAEDDTNTNVVEMMCQMGIDSEDNTGIDFENLVLPTAAIDNNMDYSPYPNKLTMLLDIMDNLPRLRLSTNHFKFILWLLKQAGVQQVPSYDSFRKVQKDLTHLCGSEPVKCTSFLGNRFYVNDPREAIKRQFANPEVAPHINLYPEETTGPISEVWQAERWKEFDSSNLTPMYSNNGKQFYVNEVAMLHDNRLVIPLLWLKRDGILHADCNVVEVTSGGTWIRQSTVQSIRADEFEINYLDIIESMPNKRIPWIDASTVPTMPNPKRQLVGEDEDLYVVMIPVWADDVSGNKSKQYNKHINLYMENSNLPGHLLQQEFLVNFLSTSPNATSPEQFAEIRNIVNETQKNPIRCYNAHTKRKCRIILRVPSLPADNPQQSEEACHIGGQGNKFCRRCHAGGTQKEQETDIGYHSLFSTGVVRSAAETREVLELQLKAAMSGISSRVEEIQTWTGTKDKITQHWVEILLQKANDHRNANPGVTSDDRVAELTKWLDSQPGDKMNPLLDIAGLDPTKDTPVEILHTILLGIIKYAWLMFHSKLSEEQQRLFTARLQSTDTSGLSIPPIRAAYMMQYKNNLIGKHFKSLMQTMVFHLHDLTTATEFEVVKAIGELGAMLGFLKSETWINIWYHDLEIRIGNVLDAFSAVDPHKISCKIKLHLLPHLIEDCRRYGPAIHNSSVHNDTRHCKHWVNNKSVIAKSVVKLQDKYVLGRLCEILSQSVKVVEDPDYILTVEKFTLGVDKHPDFDMPVLQRPEGNKPSAKFVVVKPEDILFAVSVQHDCRLARCTATGSRVVRQERRDTSRHIAVIDHVDDDNFVINTHALHNAVLLRELLPRNLTEPKPIHQDRQAYHFEVATRYRVGQEEKRKSTAEKCKTTMAAKKQAQELREAEMNRTSNLDGSWSYIQKGNKRIRS
ncbi:hypothetical protein K435DRAFT_861654 [Dendrothele bispora CBS 962.96]|uniref:Uncharacterized protein n=1 Tax=Dendrothele bispora (strain CBS 962.96) TaxID=1314807 RepID=A0A4S8LV86_DENBC|nr:hypothetical protein K435DRAFT_861654 [Dendrothele bispora CBS 962.96]